MDNKDKDHQEVFAEGKREAEGEARLTNIFKDGVQEAAGMFVKPTKIRESEKAGRRAADFTKPRPKKPQANSNKTQNNPSSMTPRMHDWEMHSSPSWGQSPPPIYGTPVRLVLGLFLFALLIGIYAGGWYSLSIRSTTVSDFINRGQVMFIGSTVVALPICFFVKGGRNPALKRLGIWIGMAIIFGCLAYSMHAIPR
jgi:hypothetical protein